MNHNIAKAQGIHGLTIQMGLFSACMQSLQILRLSGSCLVVAESDSAARCRIGVEHGRKLPVKIDYGVSDVVRARIFPGFWRRPPCGLRIQAERGELSVRVLF
jgi:hypothetical protein